ncbi:hypothetical protein Y032_0221g2574 [Ancylostoma ceylanicum]|uniref:Uncharacterized protein n=1 Tax=Ancylostoma ceylanicum TaxID=53326 RepID=A0A016SIY9_9BILA|nr:hypothetical protein Y032_0221g2574 [Ancylostoma ceylanicum]
MRLFSKDRDSDSLDSEKLVSKGNTPCLCMTSQIPPFRMCSCSTGKLCRHTFLHICVHIVKKMNKSTSIMVCGDEFLRDPTSGHFCTPFEREKDKSERMAYEYLQDLRSAPDASHQTPQAHWYNVVGRIERMSWGDTERRKRVLAYFNDGKYEARRSAFNRAVSKNMPAANMVDVPDQLRLRPDGTTFLHLETEEMQIYFSQEVISKAVSNGLYVLAADGVHQLNLKNKRNVVIQMEKGQLYTIHGVVRGGFEVPLLFAITKRRREVDYVEVFGKLKEAVQRALEPGTELEIRIVIDFELVSYTSLKHSKMLRKIVFLGCNQRCEAHFPSLHIRRMLLALIAGVGSKPEQTGSTPVPEGKTKNAECREGPSTIKGTPFLPRKHLDLVNALRAPPVRHTHPAYRPCTRFLEYFRNTWLDGPFKHMWCEYMLLEHRTTNMAENYHGYVTKFALVRCSSL